MRNPNNLRHRIRVGLNRDPITGLPHERGYIVDRSKIPFRARIAIAVAIRTRILIGDLLEIGKMAPQVCRLRALKKLFWSVVSAPFAILPGGISQTHSYPNGTRHSDTV